MYDMRDMGRLPDLCWMRGTGDFILWAEESVQFLPAQGGDRK